MVIEVGTLGLLVRFVGFGLGVRSLLVSIAPDDSDSDFLREDRRVWTQVIARIEVGLILLGLVLVAANAIL